VNIINIIHSLHFLNTPNTFITLISTILGIFNGLLCITPLCLAFDSFTLDMLVQQKPWKIVVGISLLFLAYTTFFWISPVVALPLAFVLMAGSLVFARVFGFIPTAIAWLCISTLYNAGAISAHQLFQTRFNSTTATILLAIFTFSIIASLFVAINSPFIPKKSN
jgi:hypothetical protein